PRPRGAIWSWTNNAILPAPAGSGRAGLTTGGPEEGTRMTWPLWLGLLLAVAAAGVSVSALTIDTGSTLHMSATAEHWKPFTSRQRVVTRPSGLPVGRAGDNVARLGGTRGRQLHCRL